MQPKMGKMDIDYQVHCIYTFAFILGPWDVSLPIFAFLFTFWFLFVRFSMMLFSSIKQSQSWPCMVTYIMKEKSLRYFFILCFFYACMFLFHVKKLDDYVYYCFVDISDFVYFYTTVRESSTWSKMKEIFWSSLTSFCRYLCSMKVEYRAYEVGSWKTLCINYKIWLFREADLIFHTLDKIKPHGFDALLMVVYLKSKKWDDMINFFISRA
jgi:hypothetical protein